MLSLLVSLAISAAHGTTIDRQAYSGVARDKRSKTVYTEQHSVEFSGERVQTAKTQYLDGDQKVFAEMQSDFRQMITLPEYEYKDLRHGKTHGIRIDKDRITLWRRNGDNPIEEKSFTLTEFKKSDLIVGCQGLHYYLIDNLDEVRKQKRIAIKYMMPGALDYYSFTLRVKSETEEFIDLQLSIDNIFLKMFAPALDMTYRKSDRRLVKYSGISNVTDKSDGMLFVKIDYDYQGVRP